MHKNFKIDNSVSWASTFCGDGHKGFCKQSTCTSSHLQDKPAEIAFEEDQCSIDEVSQVVEQLCVVLEDKISPVEHSILHKI